MTKPILMSCPHSGEGWCLSCVERLGTELADCYAALHIALTQSYDGPLHESSRERIADILNKYARHAAIS